MKKSLKALILCALASVVMFAVVYASPIKALAATSNISVESAAKDGNGLMPIPGSVVTGSARMTYPDGVSVNDSNSGVALVVDDGSIIGLLFFAEFDQDVSNDVVEVAYSVSYLGITYSGTVTLVTDSATEKSAYVVVGHVNLGATGYGKEINDLKGLIGNISNSTTLTGKDRVIEFNVGDSLPGDVIAAMANSKDVTLKFTFVYKGYVFCSTITSEDAKRLNDPSISWWGPCYLAKNFPTVWTGKTVG